MSDLVVRTQLLWDTVESLAEPGSELDALDSSRDRVRYPQGTAAAGDSQLFEDEPHARSFENWKDSRAGGSR